MNKKSKLHIMPPFQNDERKRHNFIQTVQNEFSAVQLLCHQTRGEHFNEHD